MDKSRWIIKWSIHIKKNIRFKTLNLRSDFYNYSDAYIVAQATINIYAADVKKSDEA